MGSRGKKPSLTRKTSIQSIANDLLLEIFLRLPDHRSGIIAVAVCKRWHSLISDPGFLTAFINHHNHRRTTNPDESPTPYTMVKKIGPASTIFKLESLTYGTAGYDLSFLPWDTPTALLASCGDLLLVSDLNFDDTDLCVCNPVTKQYLHLPPSPFLDLDDEEFQIPGLVCHPNNRSWFNVCFIIDNGTTTFDAELFCSGTRQWTKAKSVASFSREDTELVTPVVALDGVLYFANRSNHGLRGIFSFSPFEDPTVARPLALPEELLNHEFSTDYMDNICLGVVRGRLRVLVTLEPDVGFPMQVWELSEPTTSTWTLVQDVVVKRRKPRRKRRCNDFIRVANFDPNDCDAVFVRDRADFLRYQISSRRYKKVGKLNVPDRRMLVLPMESITLLHPPWPTPIIPATNAPL